MKKKIQSVYAIQILDSRGNPTVSVRARLEDGITAYAAVPSGASTGEHEACELRDGDAKAFNGKGVLKAVHHVNTTINNALLGFDASSQEALDNLLIDLDGSSTKGRLGANALLGVSLAVAKAYAASVGLELYDYLGHSKGVRLPVPLVNVINGGAHANNSLDIQEFMLVPHGAPTFSRAMQMAAETFHCLAKLLKNDGYATAVGDEGGYAPQLESTEKAFELMLAAIEQAGYKAGEEISLALDVAASELVRECGSEGEVCYKFAKGNLPEMSSSELVDLYESWIQKYPIVSIEDGLGENDWNGWKLLTERLGKRIQLVGDDLFVTNTTRLSKGIGEHVGNSILIKPNQIGTLSETLSAIHLASSKNYTSVISHRSGETEDATIADLAVATNAGQIKTGSMCRGERMAKYNRLLWIEDMLGARAQYSWR